MNPLQNQQIQQHFLKSCLTNLQEPVKNQSHKDIFKQNVQKNCSGLSSPQKDNLNDLQQFPSIETRANKNIENNSRKSDIESVQFRRGAVTYQNNYNEKKIDEGLKQKDLLLKMDQTKTAINKNRTKQFQQNFEIETFTQLSPTNQIFASNLPGVSSTLFNSKIDKIMNFGKQQHLQPLSQDHNGTVNRFGQKSSHNLNDSSVNKVFKYDIDHNTHLMSPNANSSKHNNQTVDLGNINNLYSETKSKMGKYIQENEISRNQNEQKTHQSFTPKLLPNETKANVAKMQNTIIEQSNQEKNKIFQQNSNNREVKVKKTIFL